MKPKKIKQLYLLYNRIVSPYQAKHLSKEERISIGAFYTPPEIVSKTVEYISPYLKNKDITVADLSAGAGAFILPFKDYDYRAIDYDYSVINYLRNQLDEDKVIHTNSLLKVRRSKFRIPRNNFLIITGNPPYNDITSVYKKNGKGEFICDPDLYDNDIGICFLKAFNKLKADLVCVVHPFSYIGKRWNFVRIKDFTSNYRLVKGVLFPSTMFKYTSRTSPFTVMIALYERDKNGMTYDYIENFEFKILNTDKKFVLNDYSTTDGYINKYQPRKNSLLKESPIGLYYYSFRDLNSVKRNTTFIDKKHDFAVVVTLEEFYKYAYLHCIRKLLKTEYMWLFGNLSPLVDIEFLEENKAIFVYYALESSSTLKSFNKEVIDLIRKTYLKNFSLTLEQSKNLILEHFKSLFKINEAI